MPTVSVIMAFFNGDTHVHEALDSIFTQSFRDFEVICVNDGSQSSSLECLGSYNDRINLINQQNMGQGVARNIGVKHSRGEFIAFLDQDDVWYPCKLAEQVEVLKRQPDAVLVYCNSDRMNSNGDILGRGVTKEEMSSALESSLGLLIGEGLILPSSMMVRREAFLDVGGFDPVLRGFEDFDLTIRLKTYGKFCFQEKTGMCYRIHEKGYSTEGGIGIIQSREHFLLKMEKIFEGQPNKLKLIRKMQADCYSDWGRYEWKNGNPFKSRQQYLRSLKKNPFKIRTYSRLIRSMLHCRKT